MSTQNSEESLSDQEKFPHCNLQNNVIWERLAADASRLFSASTDMFDVMLLLEDSKGPVKNVQADLQKRR
jgi:cell division septum initiation protein DivIVA